MSRECMTNEDSGATLPLAADVAVREAEGALHALRLAMRQSPNRRVA